MAKRIEKLNKEQVSRLPEFRDKWMARGLATGPCDREAMEHAADEAYRCAGLPIPKLKIWLGSPFAGAIGAHFLAHSPNISGDQVRNQVLNQVGDQVGDQVRNQVSYQVWDQVWDQVWVQVGAQVWAQVWAQVLNQVGDQVWNQVGDQVRNQVWDQVRNQVGAQVWAQVGAQVWAQVWAQVLNQVWAQVLNQVGDQVRNQVGDQVWAQVGDQVWAQVWAQVLNQVGAQVGAQVGDQVGAQVGDQVWEAGYGQQDSAWLAFYEFFGQVFGMEICNKLAGLDLLSECGWWWPFAGGVILTERPVSLHRDDQGRLHNESEAAMKYPDGWSIHAIHGVRVPADVIEDRSSITVTRIANESNAEIRRVMIERYGMNRYMLDSGSEIIHRDATGILYRKEVPNDEPIVMIRVLNSTPEPDGVMTREEAIEVFGDAAKAAMNSPKGSRFKEYSIRVSPELTKAHAAVAWTFGLTEETYHPAIES